MTSCASHYFLSRPFPDWPAGPGEAGQITIRQTAMFGAPPLPLTPPAGVHSSSLAAAGGETSYTSTN